jgi:hypothetical protein
MSTALSFAYNAHNSQKDIHDVIFRQPSDDACFREIAEVLMRHGLEKRYGLTLLHKHFDLGPGEIMVEHTDVDQRTLISRPVREVDVPAKNLVEVTWEMSADALCGACMQRCEFTDWTNGVHVGHHTVGYSFPLPISNLAPAPK